MKIVGGINSFHLHRNFICIAWKEFIEINSNFFANAHQALLFFSNFGKVYKLKTYQLPLGTSGKKGRAIVNLLPLQSGEKITNVVAIPEKVEDRSDKIWQS